MPNKNVLASAVEIPSRGLSENDSVLRITIDCPSDSSSVSFAEVGIQTDEVVELEYDSPRKGGDSSLYGCFKKPVTLADMLETKLKKRKPRTLKRLTALINESFAVNNGVMCSRLAVKKFDSFVMSDEKKQQLLNKMNKRESTDLSDFKIEEDKISDTEYDEEVLAIKEDEKAAQVILRAIAPIIERIKVEKLKALKDLGTEKDEKLADVEINFVH